MSTTELKSDNPSFVLHGVHDVKIEEVSPWMVWGLELDAGLSGFCTSPLLAAGTPSLHLKS